MAFIKIHLYYIGKPRDPNANRMAEEYIKRTTRYLNCEMREIRPERFDPWARHPAAMKILLDAAGRAGEKIPETAIRTALAWLDVVTEPTTGRVGYTHKGTGKVFVPGRNEQFDHHETLTAAAAVGRSLWVKNLNATAPIALVARDLPRFPGNAVDFYYWYYGTRACREFAAPRYREGYQRGIHDQDALAILLRVLEMRDSAGLLIHGPAARGFALFFWSCWRSEAQAALWPQRALCLVTGDGYNIQNIPASLAPATPETEHRFWYQYYFHSPRGRRGLSENRDALCKLLWRLWSPTWKFTDEEFARSVGLPDVIAHGMWTMGAVGSVAARWAGDAGRVVEYGTRDKVFSDPQHAYTRQLFAATPRADVESIRARLAKRAALAQA